MPRDRVHKKHGANPVAHMSSTPPRAGAVAAAAQAGDNEAAKNAMTAHYGLLMRHSVNLMVMLNCDTLILAGDNQVFNRSVGLLPQRPCVAASAARCHLDLASPGALGEAMAPES